MVGDYQGIAVLGAILVVGVGGVVLSDGLQRESGTVERTVNSSYTEKIPQTEPIDLLPQTPTGAVWMLLGGVLTLQAVNPE